MTEYEFTQRVKRQLRIARTDSGMKMLDIYRNTNLSYPTVCTAFQRGSRKNITLNTLKQLCDAMGVSLVSVLNASELNEKMEINNARVGR